MHVQYYTCKRNYNWTAMPATSQLYNLCRQCLILWLLIYHNQWLMILIMLEATYALPWFLLVTQRVLFCWQPYNCGIIALCQVNSVVHTVRGSVGLWAHCYNNMLMLMTIVLY